MKRSIWLAAILLTIGAGPALAAAPATEVEFFQAIEAGDIEVKFIPRDAVQANVLIENKTDKPLRIALPEAFAGVPVLAQFQQPGMMGGAGMGGGGNQGLGGGMGMGMGMQGGMFNVAPGKVGKLKVPVICLEHGKDDPNPRVPYEIRRIETFTQDARVVELCKMLGGVHHRAAQAAAWHLANGMSWEELAAKHNKHLNGTITPYFSPQELAFARLLAGEAIRRGEANPIEATSPGEAAE